MSYRLRILQRTSPNEREVLPEWPGAGPEMTFATPELAAHAGTAEVERLAALGHDAVYVILDAGGHWVEHPGAGGLV